MLMLLLELQANLKIIGNNKADKYRVPTLGNTELWNPIFLGICQLVLMDIDATYRNVGGIFYANKQSILKKKNS